MKKYEEEYCICITDSFCHAAEINIKLGSFIQSPLTGLLVTQAHALGKSMLQRVGVVEGEGVLMGHI